MNDLTIDVSSYVSAIGELEDELVSKDAEIARLRALLAAAGKASALPKPARKRPVKGSEDRPWENIFDIGRDYTRSVIVVRFADGQRVRADVCTPKGKPLNLGRGVRTAIAFYRSKAFRRMGWPKLSERTGTAPWDCMIRVPEIVAVQEEDGGREFPAAEISRHFADRRAGSWGLPADAGTAAFYRATWRRRYSKREAMRDYGLARTKEEQTVNQH